MWTLLRRALLLACLFSVLSGTASSRWTDSAGLSTQSLVEVSSTSETQSTAEYVSHETLSREEYESQESDQPEPLTDSSSNDSEASHLPRFKGFFKKLGNGIKKVGGAIWKGVKKVGSFLLGNRGKLPEVKIKEENPSPFNFRPEDIEDCVACQYVWYQVEVEVGNDKIQENIYDAFTSVCMDAQKSSIFFPACEHMFDDVYSMIADYMNGQLNVNQICISAGFCRDPFPKAEVTKPPPVIPNMIGGAITELPASELYTFQGQKVPPLQNEVEFPPPPQPTISEQRAKRSPIAMVGRAVKAVGDWVTGKKKKERARQKQQAQTAAKMLMAEKREVNRRFADFRVSVVQSNFFPEAFENLRSSLKEISDVDSLRTGVSLVVRGYDTTKREGLLNAKRVACMLADYLPTVGVEHFTVRAGVAQNRPGVKLALPKALNKCDPKVEIVFEESSIGRTTSGAALNLKKDAAFCKAVVHFAAQHSMKEGYDWITPKTAGEYDLDAEKQQCARIKKVPRGGASSGAARKKNLSKKAKGQWAKATKEFQVTVGPKSRDGFAAAWKSIEAAATKTKEKLETLLTGEDIHICSEWYPLGPSGPITQPNARKEAEERSSALACALSEKFSAFGYNTDLRISIGTTNKAGAGSFEKSGPGSIKLFFRHKAHPFDEQCTPLYTWKLSSKELAGYCTTAGNEMATKARAAANDWIHAALN